MPESEPEKDAPFYEGLEDLAMEQWQREVLEFQNWFWAAAEKASEKMFDDPRFVRGDRAQPSH